jgi:F-type H+-transporting ATPase subunit b
MVDALILLAAGAAHEAPEPMAFGGIASAAAIVAASMTVLILVAVFLKVPSMLTKGLDSSIAEIKKQLEEAKVLRAEAEALREDYARRIANAEKDAVAMLDHARHEADAIVAKAEADTALVITRREKMATDKIEAAERSAVSELRAMAADAAASAARGLISAHHGADADKALVDSAIAAI